MGLRSWWAGMTKQRRVHKGRARGTWRSCRRCGSYSYQTGKSGLCDGCVSLQ
jgi:hypothetical protein